jgi:tetratricopeptide (TPR) repeat protein
VLEQRPDATEALGVLATARILLGREETAERDLESYVAQSDRPAEGLASAVGAFLEVGDDERAALWLERLLRCVDLGSDGELRLVGMARGLRVLAGADRPGQALALVERTAPALLRHPEVLGELSGLVRLVDVADPDLAVGISRAALAQRPGDPETMALLANQLVRRGEAGSEGQAEARALVRQALAQSPRQSIEAWLALARVSRREGRVEEALQAVITAALLLPDSDAGWRAPTVDEVEALASELGAP